MNYSTTVGYPTEPVNRSRALLEQLLQDGMLQDDLKVPPATSVEFHQLRDDACKFATEVQAITTAWPLRAERWLNRLSATLTGLPFADLSRPQRQAISHAAVALSEHLELL